MPDFWNDHIYLLYILTIGALGYIIWTFKYGVREFKKWKEEVTKEIGTIKENQSILRIELPEKYVLTRKYEKDVSEIKDLLQRIFDKLDTKADK